MLNERNKLIVEGNKKFLQNNNNNNNSNSYNGNLVISSSNHHSAARDFFAADKLKYSDGNVKNGQLSPSTAQKLSQITLSKCLSNGTNNGNKTNGTGSTVKTERLSPPMNDLSLYRWVVEVMQLHNFVKSSLCFFPIKPRRAWNNSTRFLTVPSFKSFVYSRADLDALLSTALFSLRFQSMLIKHRIDSSLGEANCWAKRRRKSFFSWNHRSDRASMVRSGEATYGAVKMLFFFLPATLFLCCLIASTAQSLISIYPPISRLPFESAREREEKCYEIPIIHRALFLCYFDARLIPWPWYLNAAFRLGFTINLLHFSLLLFLFVLLTNEDHLVELKVFFPQSVSKNTIFLRRSRSVTPQSHTGTPPQSAQPNNLMNNPNINSLLSATSTHLVSNGNNSNGNGNNGQQQQLPGPPMNYSEMMRTLAAKYNNSNEWVERFFFVLKSS